MDRIRSSGAEWAGMSPAFPAEPSEKPSKNLPRERQDEEERLAGHTTGVGTRVLEGTHPLCPFGAWTQGNIQLFVPERA